MKLEKETTMDINEYIEVWNRTVGKAIDDIFAKCSQPESDQDLADEAEDRNIESYLEEKRGI
tara:strand:+ start:1246 stop:1431 length:186 start_codon:yes stop_codon:yes gene_type:complete